MLQDKPILDTFFRQRYYENAHFNFTNLFMWRKAYQIEWAVEADYLYIKAAWAGRTYVLQPFGPNQGMAAVIDKLLAFFAEANLPFAIYGAESSMVAIMEQLTPGQFQFISDRDNFDYVYRTQDLIALKGRSYHAKKNHVNSFKKNYRSYSYVPLTSEVAAQCIANALEWYQNRDYSKDPLLLAERDAIVEVLNHFEQLELTGGVITVDGKVEAFSFGEQLNRDTAVIHVEKANPDIKGIYAVINQEFCRHSWSNVEYINREEDMGIAGLRKAKKSYHPVKMVEKYVITLAPK